MFSTCFYAYCFSSAFLTVKIYNICRYLASPDDMLVLDIAHSIYMKCEEYPSALQVSLVLDNLQVCFLFLLSKFLPLILLFSIPFSLWERMIIIDMGQTALCIILRSPLIKSICKTKNVYLNLLLQNIFF